VLVLDGENPVGMLAFTPDATRLVVTRANEYPVKVWPSEVRTIATGECISFPQPRKDVWPRIAVHPSGRLALIADDGPLRLADLSAGIEAVVAGGDEVSEVIVSPDGRRAIASRAYHSGHLSAFDLNPDGQMYYASAWNAPRERGERLAGFIDGGTKFVTVGNRRFVVRDTATGEVKSESRYPAESAVSPTISADGSRLAVRSSSQFYLFSTATWKVQAQIATETRPYTRFTYHPTRPLLATIQYLQTLIKFMDADTAKVVRKFNWKLSEMRAVAFSADGTLCAAGAASGKIVVWDVDE